MIGTPLLLAGCASNRYGQQASVPANPAIDPYYLAMYGEIDDERFPVPAVDLTQIDPQYFRQEVDYSTHERPGTIIVDPAEFFAFFVLGNGRAIRYGVGVGREEAFNFRGTATIGRKEVWPGWTPTSDMVAREPKRYGPYAKGLPGGPDSPLGPRALYLYRDGQDTHYRLHGNSEPWTIGTNVSSGCIRFIYQDIIDLYRRVPLGTKVVVLTTNAPSEPPQDDNEMYSDVADHRRPSPTRRVRPNPDDQMYPDPDDQMYPVYPAYPGPYY
ncbi:L,D-transpeptidase [Methylovirgula sp. 4M-Z18]|uniref:L,D-transpeptidase n=1 Tax=Methylovirgula sp. 4M-Z18 TaxID=2293567 RepID=UPI001FE1AD53|nr:L,D-transpeptidase [Methylovirgula sp. 4M-Z18]